ncbi:hypothetical protein [Microbacterium sp.]|uniref:hypothetical protein n=1 Tax=Microbacterium sp. TaxID=51671 RepID=UPI0039E434E7
MLTQCEGCTNNGHPYRPDRPHTCAVRPGAVYPQPAAPEVEAWIEARHDPGFKPKRPRKATGEPPKLSEKQYTKLMRENLEMFGTPQQIAAFEKEKTA